MGIFDFLKTKGDDIDKSDLDAGDHATEDKLLEAKLYRHLRNKGLENGITDLDLSVNHDRVTISGQTKDGELKKRAVQALGNFQGIASVEDNLRLESVEKTSVNGHPEKIEHQAQGKPKAPVAKPATPPSEKSSPVPQYHTVGVGTTLWAVAEKYLGHGNRYMEIFEANRPMLKDPDILVPGQKLLIPPK